jgi:hypothetical protein
VEVATVDQLVPVLAEADLQREVLLAGCLAVELLADRTVAEAEARMADLAARIDDSTADVRLAGYLADASIAVAADDPDRAEAVAREAYDFVFDAQGVLGASDLRAGLGQYAERLGSIGLGTALRRDRPEEVLRWIDRIAVAAAAPRSVVPERDPAYGEAMAALRALHDAPVEERRRLEDRVRALARTARTARADRETGVGDGDGGGDSGGGDGEGDSGDGGTAPAGVDPVRVLDQADVQVAVAFGVLQGDLVGCVVAPDRCQVRRLGPLGDIDRLVRGLRSDLRSRATRPSRSRSARILDAAARLDAVLLEPFEIEGSAVVAVPASLFAVPWSGLPSRVGRRTAVTSSLSVWAAAPDHWADGHSHPRLPDLDPVGGDRADPVGRGRADSAGRDDADPAGRDTADPAGRDVVVVGPDLAFGATESAVVGRLRPEARRLEDDAADLASVLASLDGAQVAHLICHGQVRTDNPLLSNLRLADGPLHAYELESLQVPPALIVLSACHVGLPSNGAGQQLLGLVTALTSAGAGCVLASTLPVPDQEATVGLMGTFHEGLLSGRAPSDAWAELQRSADAETIIDSMAFTVFGRG